MSKLQWIFLGIIFTLYLLFGGSIFMVLEQKFELHQQAQLSVLRNDIQEIILKLDQDFYCNGTPTEVIEAIRAAKEGVISRISDICGGNDLLNDDSSDVLIKWTFYNSLFFAFTAITTIGYGNLTPATQYSRIFTIFYALIGIPINGILLTNLSDLFSSKLVKAHQRSKENESKVTFIFNILFYLIPGFLVFIIAPAGFFVMIENWTFLDAIYFCFVSLTTIGFGDYVAGMGDGHNIWLWVYKVVIIVWIVFGLGYFVMILGYITKGITSKRVRSVIEKRLYGIRLNKEKLSKEIDYMRKVVNELYILKTKKDLNENINNESHEQGSLNEFVFGCHKFPLRRIKSFNDFIQLKNTEEIIDYNLIRSFSESDIDRLEKALPKPHKSLDHIQGSMDELFSSIMESVRGNITQVLEAVNELNAYEAGTSIQRVPNHPIKHTDEERDPDILSPSPWDLNQLTESDEEILLESDDDKLKEVVVHHVPTRPNILDKMSDVIRKISTVTKMSSEPNSRKVSRVEEKRNADTRKISQENPNCVCNIPRGPSGTENVERKEPAKNKSYDASSRSNSLKRKRPVRSSAEYNNKKSIDHNSADKRDRKISREQNESISRTSSLDSIVLTQFLEALNSAEDHLHHHHPADELGSEGVDNFGYLGSNESTPSQSRRRGPRRRKVGMFNPEFKFFNADITSNIELKNRKEVNNSHGISLFK